MKKKINQILIVIAISLNCPVLLNAQTLIDGLYYSLASSGATLVVNPDGTKYSGDIVVPDAVTVDGKAYDVVSVADVLAGCPELTSVVLGKNCRTCTDMSGNPKLKTFCWELPTETPAKSTFIPAFTDCGMLESVVLPAYLRSATAKGSVPEGAFLGCGLLKSVRLPENIATVNDYAFYDCRQLMDINLPNVTDIGDNAFRQCLSLDTEIDFTKVKAIRSFAFSNANISGDIDLTNVTTLEYGAFQYTDITSVKLPETLENVPGYCFYFCESLSDVVFPASVRTVSCEAFSYCKNLVNYNFNEGLEIIEPWAFNAGSYGRVKGKITIPSTLQSIGNNNFASCNIADIAVASDNPVFKKVGKGLYSHDGKNCIL